MAASWVLVPAGKSLFAAFDAVAAGRDTASDGSIGNTAHQQEVSDHNPDETGSVPIHDADHVNEVHAIDVDDDLREPGLTMEAVVQFLLGRCRSGAEKRLRYIIYNRRIWEASNGWKQRTYTGSSPHTEHAHFSLSYETPLEASTVSWHLEDIPMALTEADKKWFSAQIATIAEKVWAEKIGNPDYPGRTAKQAVNDVSMLRDAVADPEVGGKHVAAGTALADLLTSAPEPTTSELLNPTRPAE
jgi:hypothetical protein